MCSKAFPLRSLAEPVRQSNLANPFTQIPQFITSARTTMPLVKKNKPQDIGSTTNPTVTPNQDQVSGPITLKSKSPA